MQRLQIRPKVAHIFGARYYNPSLGRFMTPDWSATPKPIPYASLANPQSLNLYSFPQAARRRRNGAHKIATLSLHHPIGKYVFCQEVGDSARAVLLPLQPRGKPRNLSCGPAAALSDSRGSRRFWVCQPDLAPL